MSKYNNEKNDPRLITKLSTNKTLCSIIAPDVDSKYENIILEFVEFDPRTFKKSSEIDIYFDLGSFLGLCQLVKDRTVLNGIKADTESMKERGKKYSDAKMFQRRGGGVVDNKVRYREFYIQASTQSPSSALLVAEECDGYKDQKGLINPKGDNKNIIRIPVDYMTLFNAACLTEARINAFLVAKQLRGAYERRDRVEEGCSKNNIPSGTPEPRETFPGRPEISTTDGKSAEIDPDLAFYRQYTDTYNPYSNAG